MFENIFPKYITAKNIIFFIMAILFLIFIIKIQDIAIMFFASYVIACSLNPLVDKIEKKFKRSVAAAIVLGISLLVLILIFIPIIMLVGNELKNFSTAFPDYFNALYDSIMKLPFIGKLGIYQLDWQGIISSVSSYTSNIVNQIINIGINISSAFIYLIVSIIIIYYFMADKTTIRDTYLHLFPKNMREKAGSIADIISKKIGGYIVALIATMASVGLIMIAGLSIFRVDYAVFLGILTAVFDIIPVVGPLIAFIIGIIITFESGWGAVCALIGVFAVAQLVENNLVRPYVFGKILDLHPIMIYLFLFITAKYMGIAGVIFAPAIAATVCVLIQELYMKNLE